MNNQMYFKKLKKLILPVTELKLKNIDIKEKVRMNFYQKYIILLLDKGIKANSESVLVEKISELLNINRKVVNGFIKYLKKMKYINYDENNNLFKLNEKLTFKIGEDNVLYADLKTQKADCDNVLFIHGYSDFCLKNQISENNSYIFTEAKGNFNSNNILQKAYNYTDKINDAIKKSFANTNYHLQDNFKFLIDGQCIFYNIEFNVTATYEYNKTTKKIELQSFDNPKENIIPEHVIKGLLNALPEEKDLPRFIKLEEPFYKKLHEQNNFIDESDSKYSEIEKALQPIKEEFDKESEALLKTKKDYEQRIKNIDDQKIKYQKILSENKLEIDKNKELVEIYKKENSEFAKEFQDSINELLKKNSDLTEKIGKQTKEHDQLEKEYNDFQVKTEVELANKNRIIKEKENQLADILKNKEKAQEKSNKLFTSYQNELHPKTQKVLQMYHNDNAFCNYVQDVCSILDCAVSAIESDNDDKMLQCFDMVRDMSKKLCKVVLDYITGRNAPNLASHLKSTDLGKYIKCNNNNDIIIRLGQFNDIMNAVVHISDNNTLTNKNKQTIKDFMDKSKGIKGSILFVIADLLTVLDFKKQDKNSLSKRITSL